MRFRVNATIAKALESARTVLRDLDADQVPASLRKVVAHAGDLTPPLADRLAREIDSLEWLREKAAAAWPEANAGVDGPDRGSALFLLRPDGWAIDLVKVAGDHAAASAPGQTKRADDTRDRDLAVARDKAKAAAKETEILRRRVSQLERAERAPERQRAATGAREAGALQAARETYAKEVGRLRREMAEAASALKSARQDARQAKRERAEAEHRLAAIRHAGSWADRDPVDLAVHLDAVAAQARPRLEHAVGDRTLPPPSLPSGVRPDSAAAVDSVLRMPGPLAVFVDGYNAGLALGKGSPGEVRSRLEDVLRRVRTLGGPGMTVTVVWDSAAEHDGLRLPDGLDVRFAPPGIPADDVLVDLAAATRRAVVVTNDREVRERAERVGALAVWSTALVQWVKKRR